MGDPSFGGRLALAALLAGLLYGPAAMAGGSAERGKAAFVKHGCWECHGFLGQGGAAGPKLAPDPIPFESLSAFVRFTDRAMPPYSAAILSDQDLADIYAYLQSVPKPLNYRTIPLLNR